MLWPLTVDGRPESTPNPRVNPSMPAMIWRFMFRPSFNPDTSRDSLCLMVLRPPSTLGREHDHHVVHFFAFGAIPDRVRTLKILQFFRRTLHIHNLEIRM